VRLWPPAVLRGHARRRADLDARARDAGCERERSRERLEAVRRDVVEPLAEAGRRNRFADMIRLSLLEGHEK